MVSGAYSVDQATMTQQGGAAEVQPPPPAPRPRPKQRAPPRPTQSPPLPPPPPSQLFMVAGAPYFVSPAGPPPEPPPRVSSMKFQYLPEPTYDFTKEMGPGRLPIYRAESPSGPEGSGKARCCGCRPRRGISLASALLMAGAALLALLLLLGAIAYFLLLADSSSDPGRVRLQPLGETSGSRGSPTSSTTPKSRLVGMPEYSDPPPRPKPSNTPAETDVSHSSTERSAVREDEEPLFKDIVVSYQPFKPPASAAPPTGDVVTAGFVPHWFREELANTGEVLPLSGSQCSVLMVMWLQERASTPNRFTTTSPVHVSPTLPSAVRTSPASSLHNGSEHGGALCHSPRLEACRGVLPYDLTALQTGAVGTTSARLEAAAGALGFAHVARGACRLAARQLLCALLEPPCQPDDRVLQPCRASCQAAVSECGEFLLSTLGLGAEFDCEQYPESRDSAQCIDLTRDCDAPSLRCTSSGACVPPQWRCDTRDDCSDSSDERGCRTFHSPAVQRSATLSLDSAPPVCVPGQARCLDGACIESSQLCDGLHHCARGEDEAVCPPS